MSLYEDTPSQLNHIEMSLYEDTPSQLNHIEVSLYEDTPSQLNHIEVSLYEDTTSQLNHIEVSLYEDTCTYAREKRRGNQKWNIQRHWQHWANKTHDEDKYNTKTQHNTEI